MTYIEARHYRRGRSSPVRVAVVHTAEVSLRPAAARAVARYFATTDRPASAHICIDADEEVRCVYDEHTAFAAPGANHDGLQIELCTRAGSASWDDGPHHRMLDLAAYRVAKWCAEFRLPTSHLDADALKLGRRGITGHADVTAAYKRSSHWDPGPRFPWTQFLAMVRSALEHDQEDDTMSPQQLREGVPAVVPVRPGQTVWVANDNAPSLRVAHFADSLKAFDPQVAIRPHSLHSIRPVDGTTHVRIDVPEGVASVWAE